MFISEIIKIVGSVKRKEKNLHIKKVKKKIFLPYLLFDKKVHIKIYRSKFNFLEILIITLSTERISLFKGAAISGLGTKKEKSIRCICVANEPMSRNIGIMFKDSKRSSLQTRWY
jgi:hypothetical protein